MVRHHLGLALASAAVLLLTFAAVQSPDTVHRWSMATAYAGLALLVATLAIGPWNVLRRRPNPVSTDLRRDVGIWAGVLSIVHFVVGWQVHMPHRYLYFLREVKGSGALVPRTDLFGFANYTGLVAVLIAGLLLALSNDHYLRRLGTARWKRMQRWNYALVAFVVAHGVAFQVIEERKLPFVLAFGFLSASAALVQFLGWRRARARGHVDETTRTGEELVA